MPEGDTIWRAAARLRPALAGAELLRFEAPRLVGPRPRPGDVVEAVDAVGKHLLVRFRSGIVLQTHLRMTGSWHLYETGARWRRPAHLARVVLEVPGWVAVCFSAPIVRTWAGGETGTEHLGPDLTAPGEATGTGGGGPDALTAEDLEAALERVRRLVEPGTPVADVLLDQRVAAGIGNVYKSELLWLRRVHPLTPAGDLDEGGWRALYELAHRLLRANLANAGRITVPGVPGGLAVYGRRGRGCPRCGTPVERAVLGRTARPTYWCPRCQPAG